EFLVQFQPGILFPDPERHGVMWMERSELAAVYDMQGAFNDASFMLSPGAEIEDVVDSMDRLLEPYGGQGAYPRADQPSHYMISLEFEQLGGTAAVLPLVFLAVAAFLLNIVISRVVILQRQQIALLKAFGYRNTEVALHYLSFALVITLAGLIAGTLVGVWLGMRLGEIYLEFYRFPSIEYTLELSVIATVAFLSFGAAVLGVFSSVRRAARLAPAAAMQPAPPATYRPTLIERAGLQAALDQPTRIILRNIERSPSRSIMTILGIATAGGLMVLGLFTQDAIEHVVEVQFGVAQRENMAVSFTQPVERAAIHELRSLPGVMHAEPFRSIPVRLRHGPRSYQTAIDGLPRGAYLRRLLGEDLRPIEVPPDGLVLADSLADLLEAKPGDRLVVEVQEGRRKTSMVPVVDVAEVFIGTGAYMDLEAANRLAGSGRVISGGYLLVDERQEDRLTELLQDRPRVAGIVSTERAIQSFWDEWAQSLLTYTFILSLFAGVIAFGVIHNSARISLSERERELASLRVLGFTRQEIAYVMLGEIALLVLVSIPLGLLLGYLGSYATAASVETELVRIPVVFSPGTFALAATVVLASAFVSAVVIARMLYRLDLIGVLKTRE
ncbi:MAG: ABC transporter permease, partial [Myxococcota bacterium]